MLKVKDYLEPRCKHSSFEYWIDDNGLGVRDKPELYMECYINRTYISAAGRFTIELYNPNRK